jgi:thioredoxin reductase (NADPH)
VLAVPVARLSAVVSQDQGLGQWIIRTMFARRQWLMRMQTGLRIVGSRSSPQTRRLLEFAAHNRLPYVWLDTDTAPWRALSWPTTAFRPARRPSW